MPNETYEILALRYGGQANRTRYFNFMADDDHASPGPIDYYVWVIRNENRTILVDTGFEEKEAALRGRQLDMRPREILKKIDVNADKIDNLIVSHMHFDHAELSTISLRPGSIFRKPRWLMPPGRVCAKTL